MEPRHWNDDDGAHLDVRRLKPPQPLVAILAALRERRGDDDAPLTVHLERDPLMLYPELAQLGWGAEHVSDAPGAVILRLRRL